MTQKTASKRGAVSVPEARHEIADNSLHGIQIRTETKEGRHGGFVRHAANLTAAAMLLCGASTQTARADGSATVTWKPSTTLTVTNYKVYEGTTSKVYTQTNSVGGTKTTYTVTGLEAGNTYFFVCTAVDSTGLESKVSNEQSCTIPGILILTPGPDPNDPVYIDASTTTYTNIAVPAPGNIGITNMDGKITLAYRASPGDSARFQASDDLENWTTLWTTTAATVNTLFVYQDKLAYRHSQRFYRTVVTGP
jgi:hypothetical protein